MARPVPLNRHDFFKNPDIFQQVTRIKWFGKALALTVCVFREVANMLTDSMRSFRKVMILGALSLFAVSMVAFAQTPGPEQPINPPPATVDHPSPPPPTTQEQPKNPTPATPDQPVT